MIFPELLFDSEIYINDLFRLDASKSFVTPDEAAITAVEISPNNGANWYVMALDSKDNWHLDWIYDVKGAVNFKVRLKTDGGYTEKTFSSLIVDETDQPLLSNDTDLKAHEPDIMSYLPVYKNSYRNQHRMARDRILAYLDEHRIWATDGSRLTVAELTDKQEFKEWSKFETLEIIFQSLSNQIDDIFSRKASIYAELRNSARNRSALRLDRNKDTETDPYKVDTISSLLVRR